MIHASNFVFFFSILVFHADFTTEVRLAESFKNHQRFACVRLFKQNQLPPAEGGVKPPHIGVYLLRGNYTAECTHGSFIPLLNISFLCIVILIFFVF